MSERGVPGGRLLMALGLWGLLAAITGYATYRGLPLVAPAWAGDSGRLSNVIVAEVYALLVGVLLVVLPDARERLRLRPAGARELVNALGAWVAAYGAALALHYVIASAVTGFPSPQGLRAALRIIGTDMGRLPGADAATWIIAAVRATMLAPIGEELLFRGALFGWLRGHLSAWPAILVTAVLFAGIHAAVPALLGLAVLLGVAAGYVRERSGSVTPNIVLHIVHNVLLVVAANWL